MILLYEKFLKVLEAIGRERCNKNKKGQRRSLGLTITVSANVFHHCWTVANTLPRRGLSDCSSLLVACLEVKISFAVRSRLIEQTGGNRHKSRKHSRQTEKKSWSH